MDHNQALKNEQSADEKDNGRNAKKEGTFNRRLRNSFRELKRKMSLEKKSGNGEEDDVVNKHGERTVKWRGCNRMLDGFRKKSEKRASQSGGEGDVKEEDSEKEDVFHPDHVDRDDLTTITEREVVNKEATDDKGNYSSSVCDDDTTLVYICGGCDTESECFLSFVDHYKECPLMRVQVEYRTKV